MFPEDTATFKNGVAMVSPENLPKAFSESKSIFVTPASSADDEIESFTSDPLLSNIPAVKNKQVFSAGDKSFPGSTTTREANKSEHLVDSFGATRIERLGDL